MSEATQRSLSSNRKKRGVVRASITKLGSRVTELEAATSLPDTVDHARRFTTRLESLAEEFKHHHFAVIDLLDEEVDLAREQETFDEQDEDVTQLALRLERIVSSCPSSDPNQCKMASGRLKHLEKRLSSILGNVTSFPVDGDICLLQQFDAQLSDYKMEFSDIHRSLLSLDVDDTSDLGPVTLDSHWLMSRKPYSIVDLRFEGSFTLAPLLLLPLRSPTQLASSSTYRRLTVAF